MESVKLQSKNTKHTRSTKKKISAVTNKSKTGPSEEERNTYVSVSAYYKAQARGFKPGNELADWLAAEAEVNQPEVSQ